MSPSEVFKIVNTLVLPFWLILIFLPKKTWRNTSIYACCILLSLIYAIYVFMDISDMEPDAFGSIEGVRALFMSDKALLAGWIHYLSFDLLIGNWMVNQSIKLNIKHYWVVPCLLFCFMLGPVGYLLFSIIKVSKKQALA